ncbi:sugar transferase [Aquiflexum lacus]|uniref:sugar transferase n=1 Tax=Aquiflexum lacus TaxID=2483805 RepID=UPI001893EB3E|nr:sugar transferase [Aquiflexum lacus]
MYIPFGKRLMDLILALVLIVLTSPFFMIVALVLFFSNNGKPFFYQFRPGLNGEIFKLIKFKTMNDVFDDQGNLLEDEKRLTNFGKIIRKASLDEIPQLWNVLIGEMSLVGPRPLLEEYLALYSYKQARRHEVRPGITGWAQVNGRNDVDWKKRFEMDVWYVDNISFKLDLKIMLLTVQKIFQREGVNFQGHVTMPKFKGNESEI